MIWRRRYPVSWYSVFIYTNTLCVCMFGKVLVTVSWFVVPVSVISHWIWKEAMQALSICVIIIIMTIAKWQRLLYLIAQTDLMVFSWSVLNLNDNSCYTCEAGCTIISDYCMLGNTGFTISSFPRSCLIRKCGVGIGLWTIGLCQAVIIYYSIYVYSTFLFPIFYSRALKYVKAYMKNVYIWMRRIEFDPWVSSISNGRWSLSISFEGK